MTSKREVSRMLDRLEDDQKDEVSLADAWRRALGKEPESAEELMETYQEELEG